MEPTRIFYVVKSTVMRDVEKDWDLWHTRSHVPEVLKQPGFLKATKLRRVELNADVSEYWTVYELDKSEALEEYISSEAAKRLRAEHDEKFGSKTRLERFVLTKIAEFER